MNKEVVEHPSVQTIPTPAAPMKDSVSKEKQTSDKVIPIKSCVEKKLALRAAVGSTIDPHAEEILMPPVTSVETRAAWAAVVTDEERHAKTLSSIAQKRASYFPSPSHRNDERKNNANPHLVVDLSEEGNHVEQQALTTTETGNTSDRHAALATHASSGLPTKIRSSAASPASSSRGPRVSRKQFLSGSAKSESSKEDFVEPVKKPSTSVKLYLQMGVGAKGRALRRFYEQTATKRRIEEELASRRHKEDITERQSEEVAAVASTPKSCASRRKPALATPPVAESGEVPVRVTRKKTQVAREAMEEKMSDDDSSHMSEHGVNAQIAKRAALKKPMTPRKQGEGRGKRPKLGDTCSFDARSVGLGENGKQPLSGGTQSRMTMSPESVILTTPRRGSYSFRGSPAQSSSVMPRPRWILMRKRANSGKKCTNKSERYGSIGEAHSDECGEDLNSLDLNSGLDTSSVSISDTALTDGDDSTPPVTVLEGGSSALLSAALPETRSRKRCKLDRRKTVEKAFDKFNNAAPPLYTCTQSPDESLNLPILVISKAFLKPAAQGGNVDSSKWLRSVFDHLEDQGENGEECMINRCELMRMNKAFAQYKPSEMRQYMVQIAATEVHSWEYLDALQKVHLSLKEGLYQQRVNVTGGIDLYSNIVVESCKRQVALAQGENIMNAWTLPCALGRALAFQEVVDTLLKKQHGSAAMFARPACHHVPMWRARCPLCGEADKDVNVLCGFGHCELMYHKKCIETLLSKEPEKCDRVNKKNAWVCPFHGKKCPLPPTTKPLPKHEVACGFSYINATAYALRMAQKLYPNHLLRTAIVDIDVHHGNGNQSVFYSDPSVLVISMHRGALVCERTGLPEFIGAEEGKGFNINLPLEVGDDDSAALMFLHTIILPVLKAFSPHLVVVALGFDALDMKTGNKTVPGMDCRFSTKVYGDFIGNLKNVVPRICLHSEGGYDPDQVGQAAVGCIKALLGEWHLTTEEQVKSSLNSQQIKAIMSRVNKLKYRLVKLGWKI